MENLEAAHRVLIDPSYPIKQRTRALFFLKNHPSPESAAFIMDALTDRSVLLKHEICYVLGQMLLKESLQGLRNTLSNLKEDEIVRHEAAEALGNYRTETAFLKHFLSDESPSVAETCYIAVKKDEDQARADPVSPFGSVDPAFPFTGLSFEALRVKYVNGACIYEQYKAMFALRNMKSEEAVHVIGEGMKHKSALFRHEVAFVFGQLRSKASVGYLAERLMDLGEHEMVRHECAEALGAIGCEEGHEVLLRYKDDASDIVRESVEVALDIHEYETGDEPEYAKI